MSRHLYAFFLMGLLAVTVEARPFKSEAREAILIDLTTGTILYEKEADKLVPPSSMSKIMTVYMVLTELKKGRLSLEDTFQVSKKA